MLTLTPSLISSRQEGRRRGEDGSGTVTAPPRITMRGQKVIFMKSIKTVLPREKKADEQMKKLLSHDRFLLREIWTTWRRK